MNPVLLANLISALGYLPQGLEFIQKLWADIEAGRTQTTVTPADLAELARLRAEKGEDIYARLGITPPPSSGGPVVHAAGVQSPPSDPPDKGN